VGRLHFAAFIFPLMLTMAALISCSDGGNQQAGFVNTSISDPAPCSVPNGFYNAVFVTVTDVQIHSSTGQWIDLTKGLAPTQINLLASANTECFLAMLGSKTELQAGTYEQIRIMLADSNARLQLATDNGCGPNGPMNCVVLPTGTYPLLLASEDKNGIKIPSGQIAGGAFVVEAGQTKDLDIDFNTCASIVLDGGGRYLLKPVLHAGEVELNSAINGKVVDASNNDLPVNGGHTVVALEQPVNGVDRVVLSTTTDANGAFALCPVQPGTYDIVVTAIDKNQLQYATTVITGVQAGTVVGNVPIYPTVQANTGPATVSGSLTISGSGEAILVSALQKVNTTLTVTVPSAELSAATQTVMVNPSTGYSLYLSGVSPYVTAFGAPPAIYSQSPGAAYTVDALTLPLSLQVCSSATEAEITGLIVNPGDLKTGQNLGFSGCIAPPPQ
jgi:Domain of unknown function (DUF4382)